jgi:hypothetical protein
MTTPIRLRLSRAKGFDLQLLSRTTNGLPAVNVARPSRWGNPFKHPESAIAARTYRAWLIGTFRTTLMYECTCRLSKPRLDILRRQTREALPDLRGYNLACWCPLPEPGQPDHCHAAVLLEVANG